ncbi:MAG: HisA/HisF-related TIM barrel protein, partial [Bacteroidota bacterium]
DVGALLNAGADKISVNSAAVRNPDLLDQLALEFGSQCVVLGLDADLLDGQWTVVTHGGRRPTDREALVWAKEAESRGAGEILLTSMQGDGTKRGYSLDLTSMLSMNLNVPVIASGGAGTMDHFVDVFEAGAADAALAASIFHFREIGIQELKTYLHSKNIPMRVKR